MSIIIPSFNRDGLLGATLDSLSAQTYPYWEALIVDDHSTDHSLEIAQQYAERDARFRVSRRTHPRKGANICRNEGLAAARGKYVIFLDSDDLLSTWCLARRVADMEKSPECDFGVYLTELFTNHAGDRKVLDSIYTEENDLLRFLGLDSVWFTTGPIWKKESLVRLGGYDEDLLSFQDWSIHVRALIAKLRYFKEPVRDNYHRCGYGSPTITSISWARPEHLLSQEAMFERTLEGLRKAGLDDRAMRQRMTGLYWFQARRWQKISDYANARRLWHRAYSQGLCTRLQYLEGCLIFHLYKLRGGGFTARLIQRSWPAPYYRHTPTPTTGLPEEVENTILVDGDEGFPSPLQMPSAEIAAPRPQRN